MSASCDNSSHCEYVGPDDPLSPVADRIELGNDQHGAQLVSRSYEDGTVYQLQVQAGDEFDPENCLLGRMPHGVWMGVYKDDHGGLFMSVWVKNTHN